MITVTDTTQPDSGLVEALHVRGPASEHADKLMLFGRFVGSWTLEWTGTGTDGQPPRAFHGSTIRFYDPAIDAWRSTWIEPVNARVRRFIGRPVDGDILLLSDEDEPQLRWRFTDIEPGSFTWRAETSPDRGATWHLDEQMHATRAGTDATRQALRHTPPSVATATEVPCAGQVGGWPDTMRRLRRSDSDGSSDRHGRTVSGHC